ncbi:MAG: hypothetical protein A4E24_01898 [Methanomethylovorans sp. PtaU1.Bin093]|jgi:hypothetical protein|uniref:hypothetical protein n=1 Tax=Methanomethylovorans sp. PtaU1.Bin093 TaxID=1811679 RepID=UPI0009C85AB1|nr:hypothetical protein [Methanomethylovorans sp. PtaU1.Bin093]OPY18485.1 MAG: hypothetical protein A4E24_01898 [Methanomethylovorans sp. PtaU1.Bin093]
MKSSQIPAMIAVAVFIITLVGVSILVMQYPPQTEKEYDISSLQAHRIVMNDSNVSTYYRTYFHVQDWRVNRTTIVNGSIPDMYGMPITPEEDVWKVQVMERTCACAGIKPIYVIEGYVSTDSGEVFNISTMKVLETSYDASTCASTACH